MQTIPEQIMDESKIDQYFPRTSYRPLQREVIQSIVQTANSGCKFIIAECPTGAGKSVIAATLARLAEEGGAYYITTTKHLQDQIEVDFQQIVTLKGRNAYPCTVYDIHERTVRNITGHKYETLKAAKPGCDEGYCKSVTGRSSCKMCIPSQADLINGQATLPTGMQYSSCPYFEQLYGAVNAQTASMNFNNFILHLNFGGKFKKRRVLIIDEAHNAEDKLLGFLECAISSYHINTRIPKFETALEYINWLTSVDAIGVLKNKLLEAQESLDIKGMNTYESLIKKYVLLILEVRADPQGWICEYEDEKNITKATLKPIFARQAAHKYLFNAADIVIFLSATILNATAFAKNLGIAEGEYVAIQTPSLFPVEHRPIVTDFAGTFTGGKAKMDQWIEDMAKKVTNIMDRYAEHRGIIHTHSFNIQKTLIEKLPKHITDRFIQQFDYVTKSEMIAEHASRPGSVIIAPAMHEGVDLKDELSRFQIVCKIPFANFYDNKQLSARMELDAEYYDMITILKLVQSVGRSIRSETDWADTFIIDQSFSRIFYKNKRSFPQWFKEAVTDKIPIVKSEK